MFESIADQIVADIRRLCSALLDADEAVSDVIKIDRLRASEELKGAVAAFQARQTVAFAASQKAEQASRGVPAERLGRGVAAQVALARRISPHEAARYVGQVEVLTKELPRTFGRLAAGEVPEWRALLVARESAWLSPEHRSIVDYDVAPRLEYLGKRKTIDTVKKLAYQLDPHGYMKRRQLAEQERHVSVRPAPDNMCRLTQLLPLKQGVAAYAALKIDADRRFGVNGETRSRGQIMADTLVERVTGQAEANAVPVEVNLVMTDQALFSCGDNPDEPAHIVDGGSIPAALARRIVLDASGEARALIRRLYLNPGGGLAALDSQARVFTENQRRFLVLRDQTCRTPWCDAPIRHADHVVPAADDGPTSTDNGQGLCESCNYAKQAPGWHQRVDGEEVVTTTPTGHQYRSRAPGLPGAA